MISSLNVASLVFGLIAWIVPVLNIARIEKLDYTRWMFSFMISFGSCAISLLIQIYYYYFLIKDGDITALIDTNGVVALAATILFMGTLLINIIFAIILTLYNRRTMR
ncbi:cytochrome c oxidase subunit 4 [Paenibacillus shirakamiensis]|uniref:Cytochrome c oxidase subunit 4 n=1 Tax=Paenibacillus shirakamiensis TaxID=1265935 RepID=A0ABS4JI12_9BACL|nr:hypothetical protein [Paenibacillus shirakamiensis]MBP2001357.1 cytochrome c oxidase subunit 4 [Paenibacillus shirakamiensis]